MSMYNSELNIKHRNRSHLFWGIDKESNEVVHIEDIKDRGLACNCRCAQCGGDFIARLGDKNQHHFGHKSNYDCLYANEIAIYLRTKMWLKKSQVLKTPAAFFAFGNRKDVACPGYDISIGDVFYRCASTQYPPLLVVETSQRPVRIILGFGNYYSGEDKRLLKAEAIQQGWDCLLINVPKICDYDLRSGKTLDDCLSLQTTDKEWIYCLDSDVARSKLEAMAKVPKPIFENKYNGYVECPLHCRIVNGKYCAGPHDCDVCRYNLAKSPKRMCLAHVGIEKYKDLEVPVEKRLDKVAALRKAKEISHEDAGRLYQQNGVIPPNSIFRKNSNTNLRANGTFNSMDFNPDLQREVDRFGRSMVKCMGCRRVVTTMECDTIANTGESRGYCRRCAQRKR